MQILKNSLESPQVCFLCQVFEISQIHWFQQRHLGGSFEVETIVNFTPPRSIRQLQSLQGKSNFLRRFIVNYAKITKGFMCLLKQNTPFVWDEIAQITFEALKKALFSAPLLRPPDYSRDFILYLSASELTIGVVLVRRTISSKSMSFTILAVL